MDPMIVLDCENSDPGNTPLQCSVADVRPISAWSELGGSSPRRGPLLAGQPIDHRWLGDVSHTARLSGLSCGFQNELGYLVWMRDQ